MSIFTLFQLLLFGDEDQGQREAEIQVAQHWQPELATVPVEELKVAQWESERLRHCNFPNSIAFIVKSTIDVPYKVWVKEGAEAEILAKYPGLPLSQLVTRGAFGLGHALKNLAVTIKTCGGNERPHILYRAVHDGHSGNGLHARSQQVISQLLFQRCVQSYVIWKCKDRSPFMSTTTELQKAIAVCASYEQRGFPGIRILKFRASGEGWDHSQQKLWHLQTLVKALGLKDMDYFEHEYLLEHSIPPQAIVEIYRWDDCKDQLDRGGFERQKAKDALSPARAEWVECVKRVMSSSNLTYEQAIRVVGPLRSDEASPKYRAARPRPIHWEANRTLRLEKLNWSPEEIYRDLRDTRAHEYLRWNRKPNRSGSRRRTRAFRKVLEGNQTADV